MPTRKSIPLQLVLFRAESRKAMEDILKQSPQHTEQSTIYYKLLKKKINPIRNRKVMSTLFYGYANIVMSI